jgi:epsilon-lactone hydrolase
VPEYRLAPEHPFPAALEDARRAYEWMLGQGVDPAQIIVAGDSSGGGLTMSLLLSLREQGTPLPGGAVLLCPGVDLTGATVPDTAQGEMTAERIRRGAEAYLAGHPLDDPVVSPLTADLTGLPPILVQGATGDWALPDAQRLVERARGHGVDARLELYPAETHVFHIFWTFLPEAADALHQAGEFAREVTARPEQAAGG